jgi:cellulose synthase/poly-beta-1,6-N-acetylglucosamine synthase-like glycosyltransferase
LTDSLAPALALASSRLAPPPTPWRSVAIHGAVLVVWVALFVLAFVQSGVLAWSVGIAYIAYDTLLQGFVGWHTWRLLRPQREAQAGGRCSVGVIVAAHNEAKVLPATIAALLAQTDPPDAIVIADDGSSDATATLFVEHYGLVAPPMSELSEPGAAHPSLAWLRLPHGGKARALNAAIVASDCDILLTVDADTVLDGQAIAVVRRAFAAEPQLAAITGVITPVCKATLAGRCLEWFQTYEYIRNYLSRFAWMQVESLLLVSGAFAGFRHGALVAVGGFDPACLVEDYELIHRMRRHAVGHALDWRFRVLGRAQARTEAPGSVGAFLRQRRRWFGGFLQTQYWYRAMVGDARHGSLGTLMLPVKAIDTLQPLYGLTAFALLVVYAATRRLDIVAPVAAVIGAKIAIDLAFHLWSVHLYRRWVGDAGRASFAWALVAALAEPFTFQLLRHSGAALGWVAFLTGQRSWGRQTRFGLDA